MFSNEEITTKSVFNCIFWFIVCIIVILVIISYALAISLNLIPIKLAVIFPIGAAIFAFIFYKLAVMDKLKIEKKTTVLEEDTSDSIRDI